MRSLLRKIGLGVALVAVAVAALGLSAAVWIRGRGLAALPQLDGALRVAGLRSPVSVARDALGVPTIEAANRLDLARATGLVHAQDRFFQMDLLRRRGAGELSELFGKAALGLDREARMHGFRTLARSVLDRMDPATSALIQAYSDGVNEGLASLRAKPWEYAVMRVDPRPWTPEDSILAGFAMTLDLQDSNGSYIRSLAAIRDTLGTAALAFFAPVYTDQDAAADGSVSAPPRMPNARELDLRNRETEASRADPRGYPAEERAASNNFAVSGSVAGGGPGIVADDMHLHLAVPNTWYRVRLRWPGHDETGVSLPGLPVLIAGSTGRIAWGLTNANIGSGDIVIVAKSISPELYHGPKGRGLLPFENRVETVAVRGSKPVRMEFPWTVWGPVVGEGSSEGTVLVFHWAGDDPVASNLGLLELEDAPDVPAALAIANRAGIPTVNFIVADAAGRIGWTIAGRVPKRFGSDGRLPVSWMYGDRGWDGYLKPGEVPALLSPPSGRLWTANNRVVGGAALRALGDGGYAVPARARQVRDDLAALKNGAVGPRDLLAIQLDDRALMLGFWREVLARVKAADPSAQEVVQAASAWDGTAGVGSVGYRLVRDFRLMVARRALDPIFQPCLEHCPDFDWHRLNYEQPLETLVRKRPAHLLDRAYSTWDELLGAAAGDVASALRKQGVAPRDAGWGQVNRAWIVHPFAAFLPSWASSWLAMPRDPLAGDANMPRVAGPTFGASERFAVAPGKESEGIFEMPGGQSGNPFSPYFRAGHEGWVRGDPTPFLPGAPQHTLVLNPN